MSIQNLTTNCQQIIQHNPAKATFATTVALGALGLGIAAAASTTAKIAVIAFVTGAAFSGPLGWIILAIAAAAFLTLGIASILIDRNRSTPPPPRASSSTSNQPQPPQPSRASSSTSNQPQSQCQHTAVVESFVSFDDDT